MAAVGAPPADQLAGQDAPLAIAFPEGAGTDWGADIVAFGALVAITSVVLTILSRADPRGLLDVPRRGSGPRGSPTSGSARRRWPCSPCCSRFRPRCSPAFVPAQGDRRAREHRHSFAFFTVNISGDLAAAQQARDGPRLPQSAQAGGTADRRGPVPLPRTKPLLETGCASASGRCSGWRCTRCSVTATRGRGRARGPRRSGSVRCVGAPLELEAIDYYTAGEPLPDRHGRRPRIPGASVRERRELPGAAGDRHGATAALPRTARPRRYVMAASWWRPDDGGAEFGALFWHKDGYSTACGSRHDRARCLGCGYGSRAQAVSDGDTELAIDVPSGQGHAQGRCGGGQVQSVSLRNVPPTRSRAPSRSTPPAAQSRSTWPSAARSTPALDAASVGLAARPATTGPGRARPGGQAGADGGLHARHPSDERLLACTERSPSRRSAVVLTASISKRHRVRGRRGDRRRGSGTLATPRAPPLPTGPRKGDPGLRHESIVATEFQGPRDRGARRGARRRDHGRWTDSVLRTGEHRSVLDPATRSARDSCRR